MPSLKPRLAFAALVSVAFVLPGAAVTAQSPSASPAPSPTPVPTGQPCTFSHRPYDASSIHLTGAWGANDDGVYYIRQHGSDIAWNGMSDRNLPAADLGRGWNNVAIGKLASDGTIQVNWMDVPRGNILGGGTLTLKVEAAPNGDLQIVKTDETGTGFGGETFRPCQTDAIATKYFQPGFSIRDDIGIGLGHDEFPGGFVVFPGDPYDSGMTAWHITPNSASTCGDPGTMQPGAAGFLDWLSARTDLDVSDGIPVTIDGHPGTSVDVKAVPGAKTCVDGALRLWQTAGNVAAIGPGVTTRVIALDVGDNVLAFEIWGYHQDQWLDLADQLLQTVKFSAA
jgi:hypothetical protein